MPSPDSIKNPVVIPDPINDKVGRGARQSDGIS